MNLFIAIASLIVIVFPNNLHPFTNTTQVKLLVYHYHVVNLEKKHKSVHKTTKVIQLTTCKITQSLC